MKTNSALESLMRECDEVSGKLTALVESGEAAPDRELHELLGRAQILRAQMRMEMRGLMPSAPERSASTLS